MSHNIRLSRCYEKGIRVDNVVSTSSLITTILQRPHMKEHVLNNVHYLFKGRLLRLFFRCAAT